VIDEVSHPYKTIGKIIIFYIFIFELFERRRTVVSIPRI
jgi:hypothetical protein